MKKITTQFTAFFQYQCRQYLLRWRWLFPLLVGLLLGYWASHVVAYLGEPSFDQDLSAVMSAGNALEAFIWTFGKPEIVYFVATALFVYLLSDLLPETSFGQSLLLRLQSRSAWWLAKTGLVLVSTVIYGLLLCGGFFLATLPYLSLSAEWSSAGSYNLGIPLGYSYIHGGPLQGALSIAGFLIVGWFAIGLLILTVNQITQRSWPGLLAGSLVVVTADLGSILAGPIGGQGWEAYLLVQNHLEYTPLWAPTRVLPETVSWIFWGFWIVACLIIGFVSSKRQDFFALES